MTIKLKNSKEYNIEDFSENISYNRIEKKLIRVIFKVIDELTLEEMSEIFTDDNVSTFVVKPKFLPEITYNDKKLYSIDYNIEETGIERIVVLEQNS